MEEWFMMALLDRYLRCISRTVRIRPQKTQCSISTVPQIVLVIVVYERQSCMGLVPSDQGELVDWLFVSN